jgi:hypothetical protein
MNNSVVEGEEADEASEGFLWESHAEPRTFCSDGKLASKFIMLLPLPRYTYIVKTLWGLMWKG